MADAIARSCSVLGCLHTVPCQAHSRRRVRPSGDQAERERFYRRATWRRVRAGFLRRHPLCSECAGRGVTEGAVEVHHRVALVDGGRPYAADNLEALCRTHHGRRTLAERRDRGGRVG